MCPSVRTSNARLHGSDRWRSPNGFLRHTPLRTKTGERVRVGERSACNSCLHQDTRHCYRARRANKVSPLPANERTLPEIRSVLDRTTFPERRCRYSSRLQICRFRVAIQPIPICDRAKQCAQVVDRRTTAHALVHWRYALPFRESLSCDHQARRGCLWRSPTRLTLHTCGGTRRVVARHQSAHGVLSSTEDCFPIEAV